MLKAAGLLAAMAALRELCRRSGVAAVHFRWRESVRMDLRWHLRWLIAVIVPTMCLLGMVEGYNDEQTRQSLGRLGLMAAMVAMAVFAMRMLRAHGGVMASILAHDISGWLARLRFIWYPLTIGLHLALAVLAGLGYYYTALELANRLLATIGLAIALAVVHAALLRWFHIAHRRLAIDEARRKREALQKERADAGASTTGGDPDEPVVTDEPQIGLAQISEHTLSLLRTLAGATALVGLWLIWVDVLPALNMFDNTHVWTYTTAVDGVEKQVPITLANVAMAILIMTVTVIASRNLPGVMEITILQRLPLDAGTRYAFSTICRYLITGVGLAAMLHAVHVGWSHVQWLIAALGIGLGFGLQEIFANFVSGLIILFERPIRVGDNVTVGDVSGIVSRIRIRATTIIDWDRKELIVPNKAFITSQLINWTLSDPITRLIVKVGIVYGSDTSKALQIMHDVARSHAVVLEEPSPAVFFVGFGDNSLNFEVRVFTTEITNRGRTQVVHALHMGIDREFRKAGIVIAFPQRDVHLDTIKPLAVRLLDRHEDASARDASSERKPPVPTTPPTAPGNG